MTKRTLIAVAACCATAVPALAAVSPSAVARPTTARCTAQVLRVREMSPAGSGGAGQRHATLTFTDSSAKACTLRGYPALQLQYDDKPLTSKVVHAKGTRARTVTLARHGRASSTLSWTVVGRGCEDPQVGFVNAPGVKVANRIDWNSGRVCGTITETPLVAR